MGSNKPQPTWGQRISLIFPIPQRYMQTFFGLTSVMNCYTMRNSLGVTITQMVKPINKTFVSHPGSAICPKQGETIHSEVPPGEYDWNQEMQGHILGAFFIGYLISHLPGGIMADLFGAKWVLNIGLLLSSLLTLFTPPFVVIGGAYALLAIRFTMGLAQGVVFPANSNLMAHWAPPKERASLGAIVMSGGILGQIISTSASGTLLTFHKWPMVFYVFGLFGLLWCIFFTFMGFSDPHTHPYIRPAERDMLEAEMGIVKSSGFRGIPWKGIFTSYPMFALICCQIGHDWGLFTMATDLPKYMNDVLQFNILTNGIVSSLPFLSMWLCSIITGFIADWLLRSGKLTLTNLRKVMTMIAQAGPAIFLVAASYAGCDRTLVVIFFTVSLFLMGPYFSGMKLTAIDLSPNYSGILMAITNGIGALSGYFAPMVIGVLTPNTSLEEWRLVFWLSFVILVVTGAVFCVWGSGEVQPWNERIPDEKKDEKPN